MHAKVIVEAEAGAARMFLKQLGKKLPGKTVKTSTHLDWNDFDPDPVSPDEFAPWLAYIGGGHRRPRLIAQRWFPGQPHAVQTVYTIRSWIWNKQIAMRKRLLGDIFQAVLHERICDRAYVDLPDYAKW